MAEACFFLTLFAQPLVFQGLFLYCDYSVTRLNNWQKSSEVRQCRLLCCVVAHGFVVSALFDENEH